jgi:endonuclease/exonuclease/phosphatase family metal-dependent hydrolase
LTTHFHDYSNDGFGGARRNNIQALASVVRWIDQFWRLPILLVGDFNIDGRLAHQVEPSVETVLYRELLQFRKAPGRFWFDVNANVNRPMPRTTQNGGSRAIDHVLLSSAAGTSAHAFDAIPAGSDHCLIRASWDLS